MSSLIVEDGTGRTDADAYASVAWVDAYLDSIGTPIEWEKSSNHADNPQKDQAIRRATMYIDRKYGHRFPGERVKPYQQSLAFPRYGLDRYDSDEIPVEVMRATAELAARVRQGIDLSPDVTDTGNVTRDRVTVGPITIDKAYGGSGKSTAARVLTEIDEILSAILYPVGYSERG